MKLIITESKRNRLAIKMLEEKYPDLKLFKHPGYSEIFLSDKGMFKMSFIIYFFVVRTGLEPVLSDVPSDAYTLPPPD